VPRTQGSYSTPPLNCYTNAVTHNLRSTFNQAAELYNEIRPRYPEALFDSLERAASLPTKARLLEIGPGTGQATKPLAERGYNITAIELGAELVAVARHELRQYTNVQILTGTFEDIALPNNAFDLVFAATAFHWIKPGARFQKPYAILKPNGHLAIIHTNHVSDGQSDAFFKMSQPIYNRYFENTGKPPKLPKSSTIKPSELDTKLFRLTHFECFPLVITYTAQQYANLLNTYSPTLALPEQKRAAFLHDIAEFIKHRFNGKIDKHFLMSLTIAKSIGNKQI
jgi:SAM-dependent methyltransferase